MSGMKLVAVLVVVALVAATSLVVAVPFQKNSGECMVGSLLKFRRMSVLDSSISDASRRQA